MDAASRIMAPAHAFGLQSGVQNNIIAVDESTVCYPVGRAIVLYNSDSKKMAFIREGTNEKGEITALALAPTKKYLAVCERDETAKVSIYHVASQRRTKTLPQGAPLDVTSNEFITAAFSSDSKMLAAVTGDCTIVLWLWDKGRMLSMQKNPGLAPGTLSRVSFNPADSNTIATTGPKYFKCWRYADGALKVWNVNLHKGREHQLYTDHCWLPGEDRCAATTDTGEIYIVEKGELRHVLSAAINAGCSKLTCLTPFARGFVAAGSGGMLCVFEGPKEEKEIYSLSHTFVCSQPSSGTAGRERLEITAMSCSPSEELLHVACASSQLASFPLANIDILKPDDHHFSLYASGGFHSSSISGLDVCVRKPLVMTCGADRTLRLWNYQSKKCEQVKHFADEPLCLAFHPSGNYALVGFSDKLRMYNVLMEDIRQTADLPVKGCRECKFSLGGQYFAAAAGPHIHIFSTYTTDQVCSLKGHSGMVRSISWREGDLGMASCGIDGAVYEWCWAQDGSNTMDRVGTSDHVFKSSQYETVVCGPRGKTGTIMVAAGRDGVIRELETGNVSTAIETDLGGISQLASSRSDRMLLVGNKTGILRAYEQPLDLANGEPTEACSIHNTGITRIIVSDDEAHAFTASEDGHLFMFEMLGEGAAARERAKRKEEEAGEKDAIGDTVLVSKGELLEKLNLNEELEQKVKEQQMQSEYQSHLREQYFQETLRKAEEDAHMRMMEANDVLDEVRHAKDIQAREAAEAMAAMEAAHMKAAEELEHEYERKLAAEAARWEALRKDKEDVQCQLEERIYSLAMAGHDNEAKLKKERDEIRSAAEQRALEGEGQMSEVQRKYEEMLAQEERDNDAELDLHHLTAHRNLVHEREEKSTLKGEQAIMRKKFSTFQAEMAKLKNALEERENTIKGLRREATDREKVIALLKKDVQEREESIADKERRMGELKAKNKELEKFKFVLDYKLRELAKEIEPRDEQIMQMRETIRELDDELQRDYKASVGMEHGLSEKQAKIESLNEEVKVTRRQVLEKERALSFFGRDVQRLVSTTDAHQLREGIKGLYRSICKGSAEAAKEDEAVQAEFANQREYMERALDALKTRVGRTEGQNARDFQKKVTENEQLIQECNALRKETRELRTQLNKTESDLEQAKGGELAAQKMAGLAGKRAPSSQGLLRPSTAQSASSVGLPKPGGFGGQKGSAGTLLKGNASAMGRERARTAEVLMSLEANQREMQMQRAEILRLREQVQLLTGGAAGGGGGEGPPEGEAGTRPASQQDRPMKHSPIPQPPRAASSQAMH